MCVNKVRQVILPLVPNSYAWKLYDAKARFLV